MHVLGTFLFDIYIIYILVALKTVWDYRRDSVEDRRL